MVRGKGADLIPDNIVLDLRREIVLKDDTLSDFYRWLDIFLLRANQLEPTSETIREDFGSESHLFREGLATLCRAVPALPRLVPCGVLMRRDVSAPLA